MGVQLASMYTWGLSYIPLPGIGSLGRTCAALARTCARTVAQKLDSLTSVYKVFVWIARKLF